MLSTLTERIFTILLEILIFLAVTLPRALKLYKKRIVIPIPTPSDPEAENARKAKNDGLLQKGEGRDIEANEDLPTFDEANPGTRL